MRRRRLNLHMSWFLNRKMRLTFQKRSNVQKDSFLRILIVYEQTKIAKFWVNEKKIKIILFLVVERNFPTQPSYSLISYLLTL